MEATIPWAQRREELLAKLAHRALRCPGLYPFREAAEFLRVAQDHGGNGDEGICRALETMWKRPEEAVQMNAQSLIRRGHGLGHPAADGKVARKGTQGSGG